MLIRVVFKITCFGIVASSDEPMSTSEQRPNLASVVENPSTIENGGSMRIRLADIDLSSDTKYVE